MSTVTSKLVNTSNHSTPSSSSSHCVSSILNQTVNKSLLFVNVREINLKLYNEIIISWNILEPTSLNDWIAIYKPGRSNSKLF